MSEKKLSFFDLTPWFPGSVKPVHAGDYECEVEFGSLRGITKCHWDGQQWTGIVRIVAWRGLTSRAHGESHE